MFNYNFYSVICKFATLRSENIIYFKLHELFMFKISVVVCAQDRQETDEMNLRGCVPLTLKKVRTNIGLENFPFRGAGTLCLRELLANSPVEGKSPRTVAFPRLYQVNSNTARELLDTFDGL